MQRIPYKLSAFGFVASLAWHLAGRLGSPSDMPWYGIVLFIGVFVVWLPTMAALQGRVKQSHPFDFAAVFGMFQGASPWLLVLTAFAFVYAGINFLLMMPSVETPGSGAFGIMASGHAMAFYAMAWALNSPRPAEPSSQSSPGQRA